ncbi:probable glutamate receptor isoform X2 [Centruroides vittatus]|uniref:probable glutamate receptor isoform X2 n=1 Tax=Centruroides vittatus TaxID=120091 RepID=UPI0035104A0E
MYKIFLVFVACIFFSKSEDITTEDCVAILYNLIKQTGWNDIAIVYSFEEATSLLIKKLHVSGIKTTIIKEDNIVNYRWEHIRNYKQGYVLLSANNTQMNWSIYILKNQLKLFGTKRKWIFFSNKTSDFHFSNLIQLFSEGDRVAILNKNNQNSIKCDANAFSVLTLNSPGNGSYYFQCVSNCIFPLLFYNFRNRILRIVSLGSFPVRHIPSKDASRWSGYVFDVINILADNLNFSYVVEDQKDKIYGIEKNGKWNGMIGKLINDKADIAAADLSWSPERAEVVEFTFPIFPEYVTFAYKAPKSLSRAWILFETYSYQVWIFIIVTSFIVAGTIFISLFINQKIRNEDNLCIANLAGHALNYAFRTLVGKSCNTLPNFESVRLIIGIWWLAVVIFTAVYSGNLTSSLSAYKTELPIDNLFQVAKKYPHFKFGVKEGSYLSFTNSSLFNGIDDSLLEIIPANATPDNVIELVRQSSIVWIAEKAVLERKMRQISREENICDIYVSKDYIQRSDWALALQKNSVFFEQFNHRIIQMHQFGLIKWLTEQYWDNSNTTCLPTDGINKREEHIVIRICDIQAVILILIIGEVFALLVFIIELCCNFKKLKYFCNT